MVAFDRLVSYLPQSVIAKLYEDQQKAADLSPPYKSTFETCMLFADVSGFTRLCEIMARHGQRGDEMLAKSLNSYFEQVVRVITSYGGDILKFAGDAMLAIWPPSADDTLETLARRAAQCGIEIKDTLQEFTLDDIILNIKVGIGVGPVSILHVGGVFNRMEYLATGDAVLQAFQGEHKAFKKEIVVSKACWEIVHPFFTAEVKETCAFLQTCTDPLRKVSVFKTFSLPQSEDEEEFTELMKRYIPAAVIPYVNTAEEQWASEHRRITVLFVNLGIGDKLIKMQSEDHLESIQKIVVSVQKAVYKYEGSLNKFLLDDKGSTLIAIFGLPPLAHEDDAVRAVLSSIAICASLHEQGAMPSVGIATGLAFCGVVGSRNRREYTVLGDTVNVAARIMQHLTHKGGGIACDDTTQDRLTFEKLPRIFVKGKSESLKLFQPYPQQFAHLFSFKPKLTRDRTLSSVEARQEIHALFGKDAPKNKFRNLLTIYESFADGEENDLKQPIYNPTVKRNSFLPISIDLHKTAIYESKESQLDDFQREQISQYTKQNFQSKPSTTMRLSAIRNSLIGGALSSKEHSDMMAVVAAGVSMHSRSESLESLNSNGALHTFKGARIHLPDHKGFITMQCFELASVRELLQKAFQLCQSRQLVDKKSQLNDFLFVFTNTSVCLPVEMELDSLASLLRV